MLTASLATTLHSRHEWHALARALYRTKGAATYTLLSCAVGCAISYSGLWLQRLVTGAIAPNPSRRDATV